MDTDKLCSCPMLNKGSQVLILVKTGNRPYLVNQSEAGQSLSAGTVLAAFGRGKFRRHQQGVNGDAGEDPKKEIKYDLGGPGTLVLYNGNLTTLGEIVEARRTAGPSPVIKVNYFDMTDKPEDGKPGSFELKKTVDVRFVPQQTVDVEHKNGEGGNENVASQVNLASLIPAEAWESFLPRNMKELVWAKHCEYDKPASLSSLGLDNV